MSGVSITVNGRRRTVAAPADTPLLWVLRESLGLTGPVVAPALANAVFAATGVRRRRLPLVARTLTVSL